MLLQHPDEMQQLDRVQVLASLLSGDCKFCDVRIFQRIDKRGCGFVTKVSYSFSGSIRELVRKKPSLK